MSKETNLYKNFNFICKKCSIILTDKKFLTSHKCGEGENKSDIITLNERIIELENEIKIRDQKLEAILSIITENSDKRTPKTSPDRKKKDHFISAEKITTVVEEKTEEEKRSMIYSIEKHLDEMGMKYYDEDEESIRKSLTEFLKSFESEKNVDIFCKIKDKRLKLLKYVNLDTYIKLLEDHYQKFIKFVESKKISYAKNKLQKYFSTLESRLIFSKLLIDQQVYDDELERFHLGLEFNSRVEDFREYNKEEIVKKLLNFDLCYNNIKQILKRELINKYGFNNVIYSELNQRKSKHSNPDDPFAFYVLEKIEKSKRNWKMDWKLQEFSAFVANSVSHYCVSLYRKLYHLVFGDNVFREDYLSKSILLEMEGEQILQNIIYVNNYYQFSENMLKLIKEFATYSSTTNDKFNIYSDDKEASKIYKDLVNYSYDNDTIEVFCQLFDNPEYNEIEKFYRIKKNL
jgi:hypothetical protein